MFSCKDARVCPTNYAQVRTWIRKVSVLLGFDIDEFRSHSGRRGGASSLLMAGVALQNIMLIGGWASESSCRLYLKQGEMALVQTRARLSPQQRLKIRSLALVAPWVFSLLKTGVN